MPGEWDADLAAIQSQLNTTKEELTQWREQNQTIADQIAELIESAQAGQATSTGELKALQVELTASREQIQSLLSTQALLQDDLAAIRAEQNAARINPDNLKPPKRRASDQTPSPAPAPAPSPPPPEKKPLSWL